MAYQKVVESEAEEGLMDRHTPLAEIDNDESSNSRGRLVKGLGMLALATAGTAAVMTGAKSSVGKPLFSMLSAFHTHHNKNDKSSWYYDDDTYDSHGKYTSEEYACDVYDDDTFYTADLCGQYDYKECYADSSTGFGSCNESYWCSSLCGDACSEGMGAICFFEKISDLRGTCEEVAGILGFNSTEEYDALQLQAAADEAQANFDPSIPSGSLAKLHDISIPGGDDDTLGPDISHGGSSGSSGVDDGHDDVGNTWTDDDPMAVTKDDDLGDSGCGRHSYCEKCKGFCRELKMKQYLAKNFDSKGGYSPKAMKQAIISIVDTCTQFGFATRPSGSTGGGVFGR